MISKDQSLKKVFLYLISVFAALYLTACGGSIEQIAQDALYPYKDVNKKYVVPTVPPEGYSEIWFTLKDVDNSDYKIHGWVYTNKNPKANTLVYFHGNGENLQSMYKSNFLNVMQNIDTNLVLIDYPSYGLSTGATNEHTFVSAAQASIEYAATTFSQGATFVWGRSIGAAVATLAFEKTQDIPSVKNLILTSPWNDLISVAREQSKLANQIPKEWLDKNAYNSSAAAQKITKPVLIHHGQKDTLVPIKYGRILAANFVNQNLIHMVEFVTSGHNDIFLAPQLWQDVSDFVHQP